MPSKKAFLQNVDSECSSDPDTTQQPFCLWSRQAHLTSVELTEVAGLKFFEASLSRARVWMFSSSLATFSSVRPLPVSDQSTSSSTSLARGSWRRRVEDLDQPLQKHFMVLRLCLGRGRWRRRVEELQQPLQ